MTEKQTKNQTRRPKIKSNSLTREKIERKKHNGISGIYMIYNTINNKIYIGSSVDIIKRMDSHLSYLRNGKHHSVHLQRAWKHC